MTRATIVRDWLSAVSALRPVTLADYSVSRAQRFAAMRDRIDAVFAVNAALES